MNIIIEDYQIGETGWTKWNPESVQACVQKKLDELGDSLEDVTSVTRRVIKPLNTCGGEIIIDFDYTDLFNECLGREAKKN